MKKFKSIEFSKILRSVLPLLVLLSIYSFPNFGSKHPQLTVASPLVYFNGEPRLLNPSNLHFISEYYLLENLSAGLVYENWKNLEHWEPRLAETWKQISETQWVFQIRKGIAWSDGSPIELQDIARHLERLQNGSFRHISILKKLKSVEVDKANHSLILNFTKKVNEGLLHELSLAESGILHPRNLEDDWSVSSGAYYLLSKNPEMIRLRANPHFLSPPEIKDVEIYAKPSTKFDVRKRPMYSFRDNIQALSQQFKILHKGFPTYSYYFYFNPKNALAHNLEARRAFAYFVQSAFHKFSYKDILQENKQVMPLGYSGRLKEDPIFLNANLVTLKTLTIELNEFLETLFPDILKKEAERQNINLRLLFESSNSDDVFAKFGNFVGNQRDSLSSWKYLYSEGGPLHPFYSEVEGLFESILSASEDQRKELLLELHRRTLEQAYLVPFLAESDAILSSDRVDLSAINPFDMRLRYYEMKWKEKT